MFSGCSVLPDSREIELGSSDEEAFPSASKNIGVISGGVDISKVPGCHLLRLMGSL